MPYNFTANLEDYPNKVPIARLGEKFSVGEFNASPEVKSKMGILHRYLNKEYIPGSKLLGIQERPDEYLGNPAETMRDEYGSLATLAARRLAIQNAPKEVKEAYNWLVDTWENKTEIKGFGEGLTAAKDYAIDIFTSPETYVTLGAVAGKTALQTALRGAGAGGAWSGSEDYIRQSRDVEIDRIENISAPQVLATTAFGTGLGFGIAGGAHKVVNALRKNTDINVLTKIEADELEVKTSVDETVAIADKDTDINADDIDKLRNTYLEAERELKLRDQQSGINRPLDFVRDQQRDTSPLKFGSSLDEKSVLDENNIRAINRTIRENPAPIKKGKHRKSEAGWDNTGEAPPVAAFYSRKDDIIYLDEDLLRSQFKDKVWETPRKNPDGSLSSSPLPKEFADKYLKEPDDWVRFVELHERAHTEFLRRNLDIEDITNLETKKEYEDRINQIAMLEMSDPRIYPSPTVIKINKEIGGGGSKTDEELNDILRGTFNELKDQPQETINSALKFNLHRYGNRFGAQIIFKPATLLNPFNKHSSISRSLQPKFRFDTQRSLTGTRKYDSPDFSETFKEIQGNYYNPFKIALHPIQDTMAGKLEKGVNRVLYEALSDSTIDISDSKTMMSSYTQIRNVLDKMGDDLFEAGVIKNKIEKDYVPRLWDRKAIENNKKDFAQRLVRAGEAKNISEAQEIVETMLNKENQIDQGGGGGAGFFYNRVFKNIKNSDFSEYLDTDLNSVMLQYIAQSSKAIAKRKVLGVNNVDEFISFYVNGIDTQMREAGKSLTLRDKNNLIKLYNYSTGENLNRFEGVPSLALDIYATINRMAYLPLATISSLTEIFINVAKAGPTSTIKGLVSALGDARKTIQDRSLEVLVNKKGLTQNEAWRELQEFGMALDPIMLDTVERLSGSMIRNQTVQKVNNVFFRLTFLDQWTRFVQLASYKTGKDLISKNLNQINKLKGQPDSSRIRDMKDQLNELGVDINQGLKWIDSGASIEDDFYKNIKRGAARYTNEVILNPTGESGLKPFWTGDPKSAILFQFLGYPLAFSNTVLKNAGKAMIRNPRQNVPKVLAGGLIMTEMARWTNWARSRGESEENKSPLEIYTDAVYRWGGSGIVFDLMTKAKEASEVYQDPIAGISAGLGPVGNDVYKIMKRGDIVRIMGEKLPLYGALGLIAPEFKEDYKDFLKEGSKDVNEAILESIGAAKEVEPIRLNRAEGGEIEEEEVSQHLKDNAHLNFVQRIFNPELTIELEKGRPSTHMMASAEVDGKEIVYPTIVEREPGKLTQLSDDEAIRYALKTGEYIEFKNAEEARAFAKGAYKKGTRLNKAKGGIARESYAFGAIVKGATKLAGKGVKLFHGTVKDFDSFDPKYAQETAFGKGFSFTPDKKIAKNYGTLTPREIKNLYGKDYVDAALDRKKEGVPTLYEVNAELTENEILLARKNFNDQNSSIQNKINKLIEQENIDRSKLDLDKPKFWRQLIKESNKDADELFSKYGIKASLKDATESEVKQVGGKLEYTIYDPQVLSIVNKQRIDKAKGGEVDVPNAAPEPDERIDRMTGLPYNLQAGIPFRDEEDPIKRLGLAGGGRASTPMQRLGFERGGFLKDLAEKAQSVAAISDKKQMAIAKKLGFSEEHLREATAFGETFGSHTQDGGRGDAARHILLGWAAAQTKNPNVALKIINTRDYLLGIPTGEGVLGIEMDTHNNQVGFSIGDKSITEVKELIPTYVDDGTAKVNVQ